MAQKIGWVENNSGNNTQITTTRVAAVGKQHVIYHVSASHVTSAANGVLLQILDDATVVWEAHVFNSGEFTFPNGIAITRGNACSAVYAASGSLQKVNLHGTT